MKAATENQVPKQIKHMPKGSQMETWPFVFIFVTSIGLGIKSLLFIE